MKYYIASRLENATDVKILSRRLKLAGWHQTYDWTVHGSVQKESSKRIGEVANAESAGVMDADILIVLLPGGRGTHVETGIAMGLGKPIYLLSYDAPKDFGTDGRTCAFYHHPLVKQCKNSDELFTALGVV